jgi:hypothetical protein
VYYKCEKNSLCILLVINGFCFSEGICGDLRFVFHLGLPVGKYAQLRDIWCGMAGREHQYAGFQC